MCEANLPQTAIYTEDTHKLNLTKIQSLPIIGKEWQYMFYVDLSFDQDRRFHQAVNAISPLVSELKILGEYQDGKQSI